MERNQTDGKTAPPPLDDCLPGDESGAQTDQGEQGESVDWKAKHDELYQQYLRLAADFDNFRKRFSQEIEGARRYGTESTLQNLLPFLDNLERAGKSLTAESDAKLLYQSFSLVKNQLLDTLTPMGLKRMDVIGQPFDPTRHEAVAQVPVPDKPEETIIEEQQCGYLLHDRVLRVPQVIVSTRPAQENPASQTPSPSDDQKNPFAKADPARS